MRNYNSLLEDIQSINEITLDNPYPFTVKTSGARGALISFDTDVMENGIFYSYSVYFNRSGESNHWSLTFKLKKEQNLEAEQGTKKSKLMGTYGTVDAGIPALRVFSTIKAILKRFVQKLHPEFESISFSGSDSVRDRLYRMGTPKIAAELDLDYENVRGIAFYKKGFKPGSHI